MLMPLNLKLEKPINPKSYIQTLNPKFETLILNPKNLNPKSEARGPKP